MRDAIIGLTMDRSGSMYTMWDEAVGGFNGFVKDQAKEEGNAWLILTYFDNNINEKYYAWNVRDIPELSQTDAEIHPGGTTALYDATMQSIARTENWLSENAWFDGEVVQVIITDGIENASETRGETLKAKISEKEFEGWNFIYLAANVDTKKTAQNLGIGYDKTVTYDSKSVGVAYAATSGAVSNLRSAATKKNEPLISDDQRDVRNSNT